MYTTPKTKQVIVKMKCHTNEKERERERERVSEREIRE